MKRALSPRIALLVIAALFILPLLLAWLMYTGAIGYKPPSTRNLGQLVQPPLPLDWAETTLLLPEGGEPLTAATASPAGIFAGHWVILKMIPDHCDEACLKDTSTLRQVHLATGRHQQRVRIALLLELTHPRELERTFRSIYDEFHLLTSPSGALQTLVRQAATRVPGQDGPVGGTYLIDPLGNIMMFYEDGYDPNHLKRDLKRLLTWSKLDEQ